MSSTLFIKHDRLTLSLTVEDVRSVKPHEETIPHVIGEMVSSLKREEAQLDPIIVDQRTGVALDGMHRLAALKQLGARRIVVCRVDYRSTSIRLKRWLRACDAPSTPLLEDLKVRLDLTRSGDLKARRMVDGGKSLAALITRGTAFYSLLPRTKGEDFEALRVFDGVAANHGLKPRLVTDLDIEDAIASGALLLYTPRPKKKDVVMAGLSGKVLPPKTTRHLVPARPMGLAYPLNWLKDDTLSLREANRRLGELVASRRLERVEPGTKYGDRTYEETLYVFSPKQVNEA